MKKLVFLAMFLIVFMTCSPAFSAGTARLYYDGKWHDYKAAPITLQVDGQTVSSDMPPVILNNSTLVPARLVFEKLGAKVEWDAKKQLVTIIMAGTNVLLKINDQNATVNKKVFKMPVPPKIINSRTMIPARFVAEAMGMKVEWAAADRIVKISQPLVNITDIGSTVSGTKLRVTVAADSAIGQYNAYELNNSPRLAVDINNGVLKYPVSETPVESSYVYKIRTSQYSVNPNITRIVVDLSAWTAYSITLSPDKKQLYIDFSNGPAGIDAVSCLKTDTGDRIDLGMKYARKAVIASSDKNGNVTVDIPMSVLGSAQTSISPGGNYIKGVSLSQYDQNTVRLNINTTGVYLLETGSDEKGTWLTFTPPSESGMSYSHAGSPSFTLKNEKIGNNYFNYVFKKDGSRCTVSLNPYVLDMDQARLVINDGYFDYIDFKRNNVTLMTDITINGSKAYDYRINSVDNSDEIRVDAPDYPDAAATGGKAPESGPNNVIRNMTVVIDPGHGGNELGATYPLNSSAADAQVKEKDINLDISKKLYTLLSNSGMKVLMTRQDDRDVGLYDRSDFANSAGAALFVSIHSNSDDNGDDGTMTLFYPAKYDLPTYGISSERVAQIIQEEMIKKLGTKDRGLWKRPGLAVLNSSRMPAIIAEIAYISDSSDRQKLLEDSFRQKAAEAVYSGIIKALNEAAETEYKAAGV